MVYTKHIKNYILYSKFKNKYALCKPYFSPFLKKSFIINYNDIKIYNKTKMRKVKLSKNFDTATAIKMMSIAVNNINEKDADEQIYPFKNNNKMVNEFSIKLF